MDGSAIRLLPLIWKMPDAELERCELGNRAVLTRWQAKEQSTDVNRRRIATISSRCACRHTSNWATD
jgi:hypothetical protein